MCNCVISMIFNSESTVLQRNKYHSSSVNLCLMIMSFISEDVSLCDWVSVVARCIDIDLTIVQLKLVLITFPQNQSQLTELTSELSTQLSGCL